jgi:hypothetical protein
MGLSFPSRWRFEAPKSANGKADRVPPGAVQDFMGLIRKTATQGDLQSFLEHYKGFFCTANGTTHYRSSNVSWAETDLQSQMDAAAANPPLFLEALFEASEVIRRRPGDLFAPDAELINCTCRAHDLPYEIQGTTLVLRDSLAAVVPVPDAPPTLAERAQETLQTSLRRAEDLLGQGRGREALQETLWLLETVATAFRGAETGTGTIEGKYFNDIIKDLRRLYPGTTLERVLKWAAETHGYLSSPTGGGVRHGLDLNAGIELSLNEARLFCNLIRSYLSFLLSEHERLSVPDRR